MTQGDGTGPLRLWQNAEANALYVYPAHKDWTRDKGDLFPAAVSEGQTQCVALARALIGPRTLVLADEPTGALDTATGTQVLDVLRTLIDAGGSGLLVTHEPRVADWADRTLDLRDGRLAWE